MRTLMLLTTTFAIAACSAPPEPPALDTLDVRGGCGDVGFFAHHAIDFDVVARLGVLKQGLLGPATTAAAPVVTELDTTDPSLVFLLETGDPLSDLCSDNGPEDRDVTSWTPVAGTVTITITPFDPEDVIDCDRGSGTARIEDLAVELDGEIFELGDIDITAPALGSYPDSC